MKQTNRCIAKEFYNSEISDIICENQHLSNCNLCQFWGTISTINGRKYVKRKESQWVSLRLTPPELMIQKLKIQ